jgi:ElaB/YqjD/DUF883 family membrane-anchored ribosome-binding protein
MATDHATPETMQPQDTTIMTEVRDRARAVGTHVYDRAAEVATQVRDQARDLGAQIKAGTQDVMHQAGHAAAASYARGRDATGEALGTVEHTLESYIRAKPLQCLLIAAGIGILAGVLYSSKK